MNDTYMTPFTKALLTGLFVGITATVLCIAYNIVYRDSTGFALSDYINVSSLIFAVNLIFLVFGMLYYAFSRIKKGEVLFIVVMLLVTAVLAFLSAGIHRSEEPLLNKEFHQLFLPMVILIGLLAALGIPYLYHSRKFAEHVL
ncbi:MAG: hypothetical protein EOO53_22330 [Gammaproteobacteria bacterium]|nr:MAG: hypothetical protein EOO53_22330 [Gammaproteobacteria bacterium]